MPTVIAGQSFGLQEAEVRNAFSPGSIRLIYVPGVTLASSAASVDLTAYIPADTVVVSYWYAKQATTSSKVVATAAAVAGASAVVDIFIVVAQSKMQ